MRFMFQELEDTVYKDGYTHDPDLKRWSNQGVLMLNTAFTTTITKIGVHYELWQPLMAFILDTLAIKHSGLVYVFMGKVAKGWSEHVPESNYKLFTTHPASASHQKIEKWDSGDVFNKINDLTYKQFKEKIIW